MPRLYVGMEFLKAGKPAGSQRRRRMAQAAPKPTAAEKEEETSQPQQSRQIQSIPTKPVKTSAQVFTDFASI